MSTEEDLEALARLVDPKAWREPILPETYRAVSRDESLMKADAILAAGFHRTPAPAPADSPPAYLALDLWMALGMPSNGFDGYYERNGWADTWANLLDAIRRQSGRKECPIIADGEGCVLINGHIGPHMGASDVGSSEPLPLVGAAVSTPQDTEWEYGAGYEADNGIEMRWFSMDAGAFTIREAAEWEVERFADPQIRLVRRTRPGPWERLGHHPHGYHCHQCSERSALRREWPLSRRCVPCSG